jgi:hypothetical protein
MFAHIVVSLVVLTSFPQFYSVTCWSIGAFSSVAFIFLQQHVLNRHTIICIDTTVAITDY